MIRALPSARPWEIIRPAMVTTLPLLMSKTRLASLPLMVSWLAPGPSMSRLLVIASSPLVRVIVWPFRLGSKTMVSLFPRVNRPGSRQREGPGC